ncbi:MAG: hypothetical protein FJ090_10205 [Deltaproteobacteria bacterium]|nr:hypothetical protein [Deltaproteobacteria bacterium]
MSWRGWWTPVVLLAFAVVFTWPAAVTGDVPGHQPDALGTVWFLSAAPRLLLDLTDPLTGFPEGARYGRPDSFTLLVLGQIFAFIPAPRLYSLLLVVGVATSAWAAEAFARALGARAPWSLLAGVAFMSCGLASTALLEGYGYHALNPWLPLFALAWLRATSPGGTVRDGLLAGGAFLLALLTTAWLGLAATLLALGFLFGGLFRGSLAWRAVLAAPAVLVLPLAVYVKVFIDGGGATGSGETGGAIAIDNQMVMTAIRLAGPGLSIDVDGHNQSAAMPAFALALVAAAPIALREHSRWRTVALTGLGAGLLAAAPRLPPETWSSLGRIGELIGFSLLRFPERLGWAWVLCAGAVGARVATGLGQRGGPAAYLIFLVAIVDVLLVMRMPWRQREASGVVPSAYAAAEGPVLDLWPEELRGLPAWALRTTNTACFYQSAHRRPIADHCLLTYDAASPRVTWSRWLTDRLFVGDVAAAEARLAEVGFATIALHGDYFSDGDRLRLGAALAQIDAAPAHSTDGGEAIWAYAVGAP